MRYQGNFTPLVYDIGLHNGGDTRHYLKEGCRVIAIDANPAMCAAAAAEFRSYVDSHQLTILNCGIAEQVGKLEFWICDDVTEWSSFNRELASRNGSQHHNVQVDCIPIQEIIGRFGVPDYMKIDIEGSDMYCLKGLTKETAPRYISIEMYHQAGDLEIRSLHELGYRRFKIICQNNAWNQVTKNNLWFYSLGPNAPFVPISASQALGVSVRTDPGTSSTMLFICGLLFAHDRGGGSISKPRSSGCRKCKIC